MISSSHLWGYLADTRGRKKMLVISLVLDGICGLLSSIAHSYWLFATLRFFNGFFVCAASAVVFVYLGEFHSGLTRSRAVMHLSVFISVGTIYQQGLAWLVIPQEWALNLPWLPQMFRPWRLFVILNAMPSIITASLLFFMPESPKFLFTNTKKEEAVEVLRRMFALNTGRNIKEYPVERVAMDKQEIGSVAVVHPTSAVEIVKSMWLQTKPLFQRPNLFLTVLTCLMQFAIYASFNGFAHWLPDIYSRLAVYAELRPNHTLTVCGVVSTLSDIRAAPDTFILSTDVDIQMHTEINNLTYTELMMANNTTTVPFSPVWSYTEDAVRYDVAVDTQNSTAIGDVVAVENGALTYTELMMANKTTTVPFSPVRSYTENAARYNVAVDTQNNTALVGTVAAENGTLLHSNTTSMPTCIASISEAVFRNSLFIGVVCAIVYTSSGYLVDCIDRKKLMMAFLLTSSVSGILLLVVTSELLVVALSSIFIATAGVCVNILNNVVIDNIPTKLRAMAVCLSLMSGRLGVTMCSLVLGLLLDYACTAAFCLLSGIVLVCCFLTYLLPGSPKNT